MKRINVVIREDDLVMLTILNDSTLLEHTFYMHRGMFCRKKDYQSFSVNLFIVFLYEKVVVLCFIFS
jgi:hypothetical protein